ncbi:hypothetical protein PEBR_06503 [Penicillium brasilianum]|uniref:BHLH domain-containing protein n=1 Tax=Penicillium brasilianum TaxID=104259 RepID=A0A1S9RWV7_PENBI|nr:hypothetical protein PEBR_06503 [Penicillium brasilianum]
MQHLGNNVPQGPGLIEKSFIPFDLDYLESCGSNNNKACDDQSLCNDLQNCVPASMNLSNNGGFPFVWNNEIIYDEYSVMPEHPWCPAAAPPIIKTPELSDGSQGTHNSAEVYQESQSLSPNSIDTLTPTPEDECNPEEAPESGLTCKTMTRRQKIRHSQSERRYRRKLEARFSQLEDVVSQCHDENSKAGCKTSKRLQRVQLLGMARLNILELQREVMSLKRKLQILREATMPDTCRFTLQSEAT